MEEATIKKLMTSAKCSGCGQRYEIDDIEVIGHHDELWFMSVFCMACHAHYLVAANVDEETAGEVVTDLSVAELEKFRDADGLKADEVLDMHDFLKEFDGDFSRLFSGRKA
ncbi:MAG TPA: hypothetical protein G4O10_03745 [Dehalococcoidia bacterium]|nr:hypothetical protein [Dehalococcoidia bacterium]